MQSAFYSPGELAEKCIRFDRWFLHRWSSIPSSTWGRDSRLGYSFRRRGDIPLATAAASEAAGSASRLHGALANL